MSGLGLLVTATECTERVGHNEVGMDKSAARGNRRVADEGRAATSDEAPSGSENASPSPDATAAAATTPRASPREEGEEEEGDAAAKRGDVELCKRKETRYWDLILGFTHAGKCYRSPIGFQCSQVSHLESCRQGDNHELMKRHITVNLKECFFFRCTCANQVTLFRRLEDRTETVMGDRTATVMGERTETANGEGLKFSKRAMTGAAAAGHLEMVKWLHEKRVPCTREAMDISAQEGHLEIVKWLHENSTEGCSPLALAMAASRGHIKMVQWFYDNNIPADISKAINEANDGGHAEVVDWLRSHSSNKKARVEARAAPPGASAGSSQHSRSDHGAAAQSTVVGMFGSPFGNFTPVNGVLPSAAAQSMGSTQPSHRLRNNMLRSPELALAASGSGRLSATDERQLKAVMEFRKAYSAQPLEGANIPKDPFTLFAVWFEEARIARASEPGAMCLSTVGPTGRPSARYVMLQGFDKRGFVWYTNFESRKSQEMSHNPYGALSFWWSEVQRAVRIEGVVCKVSEKESIEYFRSRPRGSQVGAWALHQSRPIESRGSLEANVKEVQNKFSSMREVPRPSHFGGFRLRPDRIEFWKGRQTRIHDRIVYVIMDDKWVMQRLQP